MRQAQRLAPLVEHDDKLSKRRRWRLPGTDLHVSNTVRSLVYRVKYFGGLSNGQGFSTPFPEKHLHFCQMVVVLDAPAAAGLRIARLREYQGWSPSEFAGRAGLSRQSVYDLEGGKRPRALRRTLEVVAVALGWQGDWRRMLTTDALEPPARPAPRLRLAQGTEPANGRPDAVAVADRVGHLEQRIVALEEAMVLMRQALRAGRTDEPRVSNARARAKARFFRHARAGEFGTSWPK
jgi:transcriptional regulator with XRE-family HTH domain